MSSVAALFRPAIHRVEIDTEPGACVKGTLNKPYGFIGKTVGQVIAFGPGYGHVSCPDGEVGIAFPRRVK